MTVRNEFTLAYQAERAIMNALVIQSHTIKEIEQLTRINYYTLRRIMVDLDKRGVVKVIGLREHNARVYKLAAPGDVIAKESLPKIKGANGEKYKLHLILNHVGKEKTSLSGIAATAAPRLVTRLFMAALRSQESDGNFPVGKQLDDIRLEMTNNLKQLEFIMRLYKTVLDNENFWDSKEIQRIAYDVDFNKDDVIKAYKHYYPED